MFLTRFWKDTAGNVAMIFGLATLPAMTSAGAALDILTAYNYQAQMQAAADAAALASAANEHKNSRERERIAHEAFRVNMEAAFPGRAPPQGSLTVRDGVHRYTASAEQPTSLMKLVGIRTIDLDVEAEAMKGLAEEVEFVIAFDVTNSMVFSPGDFERAKTAVKSFIERAFAGAHNRDAIGTLLPFSDRVRLGNKALSMAAGAAPPGWGGCLDVRPQTVRGNRNALTDDPPRTLTFRHFMPYTANEHPSSGSNSYSFGCFGPEITGPVRHDPDSLLQGVDNLFVGGTGRVDEGMAWAWRVLSPRWVNQWNLGGYPQAYSDVKKIAILVTDGRTEAYRYEALAPNGVPNVYGWNMGSRLGFENLEEICTEMKRQGIEIHVVALPGNSDATAHLSRCASGSASFYNVTDIASFEAAFQRIGSRGGVPRLTR